MEHFPTNASVRNTALWDLCFLSYFEYYHPFLFQKTMSFSSLNRLHITKASLLTMLLNIFGPKLFSMVTNIQ